MLDAYVYTQASNILPFLCNFFIQVLLIYLDGAMYTAYPHIFYTYMRAI